jgi:hypothetical protein
MSTTTFGVAGVLFLVVVDRLFCARADAGNIRETDMQSESVMAE